MKYIKINSYTLMFILLFLNLTACFDEYKEETLKRRCEETPCTDTQCLHWDSIIKRCGTESALLKELKRISPEKYEQHLKQIDSTRKIKLEKIERRIVLADSLSSLLTNKLKKQRSKESEINNLILLMNNYHFCKTIKECSSNYCWQLPALTSEICH
ncbi:MAG: hypothetical protein SPL52_06045 [Fibrobacter sp.]|nr:hypothetical protein [Fibrobacter sp.]